MITRGPDAIDVAIEIRKALENLNLLSRQEVKYSQVMAALKNAVLVSKEDLLLLSAPVQNDTELHRRTREKYSDLLK
jgi:hypothetical protein